MSVNAQVFQRTGPEDPGFERAASTDEAPANGGDFSNARGWKGGLSWDGNSSFTNAYGRYFFNDRTAVQLGWEYDRDSEDIPSTNESVTDDLFSVRAGLLYELQDKGRWRSYVLPHIAYDTRDFGDGGNASGFTAGLSVGGDVKVSRGLSLGLESGIQYSTFSNEFEGTSTGDSNKLWAGKYNRLNFTLRFPHDTSRDERGRAE